MKILITGNMGYIGPCVVRRLRTNFPDAILMGFDMGYFANFITNTDILPECRVDVQYFGDIRNFPNQLLEDVDIIVHLAAISNDPMGKRFEQVTFDVNYKASIELAQNAKIYGVKVFVFASSCSIYGFSEEGARNEKSPLNPLSAYAKSKILTEKYLKGLADEKFKVTCLRFATACGMSERLRLDLVLNDFVADAVISKQIKILSDGEPWRPLINIKDMAKAIEWAIMRDFARGGYFLAINVGSNDRNYQVKVLAEAIAMVIPGIKININQNAQPDKRSYRVSFDLYNDLASKYQPEVDLLQSINELRDGIIAMGFNNSEFRDSKFIRLKALLYLRNRGLLNSNLEWMHARNNNSGHEEAKNIFG